MSVYVPVAGSCIGSTKTALPQAKVLDNCVASGLRTWSVQQVVNVEVALTLSRTPLVPLNVSRIT